MKRVCKNCRCFDPFWDETPDGRPVLHEGSCGEWKKVKHAEPES